jgi:hypothetical protein
LIDQGADLVNLAWVYSNGLKSVVLKFLSFFLIHKLNHDYIFLDLTTNNNNNNNKYNTKKIMQQML